MSYFSLFFLFFLNIFSGMGPKTKPRGPPINVTEAIRLQILSRINDFREVVYGETTPANTMPMKYRAWSEVLDLCHKLGANYKDINHLKDIVKRWKSTYLKKKVESTKTGKGGDEVQMTACDNMIHQIIYGSREKETFEVIPRKCHCSSYKVNLNNLRE